MRLIGIATCLLVLMACLEDSTGQRRGSMRYQSAVTDEVERTSATEESSRRQPFTRQQVSRSDRVRSRTQEVEEPTQRAFRSRYETVERSRPTEESTVRRGGVTGDRGGRGRSRSYSEPPPRSGRVEAVGVEDGGREGRSRGDPRGRRIEEVRPRSRTASTTFSPPTTPVTTSFKPVEEESIRSSPTIESSTLPAVPPSTEIVAEASSTAAQVVSAVGTEPSRGKGRPLFRARAEPRSLRLDNTPTEEVPRQIGGQSRRTQHRFLPSDVETTPFQPRQPSFNRNLRKNLPQARQDTPDNSPLDNSTPKRSPLSRGTAKASKNEALPKSDKEDDKVRDDDNYPEVYKQLKKSGRGPAEILALLKQRKQVREAQERTKITVPDTSTPSWL